MKQKPPELIDIFSNGCLYYAHTKSKYGGSQKKKELGFYTIVFYEKFSEHYVIASFRGPVVLEDEELYIRKIVGKETSVKDMQELCSNILVSLLRKDVAQDWYCNNVFVPGKQHFESVQDYIKKDPDFPISAGCLTLPRFVLLED